jgi:hypothetical protein
MRSSNHYIVEIVALLVTLQAATPRSAGVMTRLPMFSF